MKSSNVSSTTAEIIRIAMSERRPAESVADVTKILADDYWLEALKVTELVSFDSRNFAVEAVPLRKESDRDTQREDMLETGSQSQNTEEDCNSERPYVLPLTRVLKIFNKELCTEEKLSTTKRQIEVSQCLRQKGFLIPEVLRTKEWELMAKSHSSDSCVLLMTMLPGTALGSDKSRLTPTVLNELGVLLASMHQALKECNGKHMEPDPLNPWAMENIHLLSDYLHCIQDEEDRKMLAAVIAEFKCIRDTELPLLEKA